jgi:hypothetical protein
MASPAKPDFDTELGLTNDAIALLRYLQQDTVSTARSTGIRAKRRLPQPTGRNRERKTLRARSRGDIMAQKLNPIMVMTTTTKTNETAPRLLGKNLDILERQFLKNPKPTSQMKRQLAEDTGVDMGRINVNSIEPDSRLLY